MSDLKNQIFTLLKKCPDSATGSEANYHGDRNYYSIVLHKKYGTQEDIPDFSASLTIFTEFGRHYKSVELTEREFMDLKWTMEEWNKVLEDKAFEEFKDFAENEPNSMDDLLKDE